MTREAVRTVAPSPRQGRGRFRPEPVDRYGYPVRETVDSAGQVHTFGACQDWTNGADVRWLCTCGRWSPFYRTERSLVRWAQFHLDNPEMSR